jgi:hypothetical protein
VDEPAAGGTGGSAGQGGSHQAGSKNDGGKTSVAGSSGTHVIGGATSGGDGGAGNAPIEHRCTDPVIDTNTGLVQCKEGYRHRPAAQACGDASAQGGAGGEAGTNLPRANGTEICDPFGNASGGQGGASGANCEQFAHGYCEVFYGGFAGASGVCQSGCVTDDDCGAGSICVCDEPKSPTGGVCQPSNCKVDDDCGAGSLCASYEGNGCNANGFACQNAKDDCQGASDCSIGVCNWDATERRHFCDESECEP